MNKCIALVGLPGSGKSTIGRQLANRIGFKFLDLDSVLVAHLGISISDYFAQYGEEAFREQESIALKQVISASTDLGLVLATGGGAVLRDINRELLNKCTLCVFLDVTVESLIRRLQSDNKRPLLQGGGLSEKILSLRDSRRQLYMNVAHIVLEADRLSPSKVVQKLIDETRLEDIVKNA